MNHDQLPELSPDLKSLAADVASLTPAGGILNRDELLYRAGWAACASSSDSTNPQMFNNARAVSLKPTKSGRDQCLMWLWPLSTAGLLMLAATLGITLAMRAPEVPVVYVEQPGGVPPQPSKAFTGQSAANHRDARSEGAASFGSQFPSTVPVVRRTLFHPGANYLSLRERVLTYGVDMLPTGDSSALHGESDSVSNSRYAALLDELRGG
jgi:hypothetical protein